MYLPFTYEFTFKQSYNSNEYFPKLKDCFEKLFSSGVTSRRIEILWSCRHITEYYVEYVFKDKDLSSIDENSGKQIKELGKKIDIIVNKKILAPRTISYLRKVNDYGVDAAHPDRNNNKDSTKYDILDDVKRLLVSVFKCECRVLCQFTVNSDTYIIEKELETTYNTKYYCKIETPLFGAANSSNTGILTITSGTRENDIHSIVNNTKCAFGDIVNPLVEYNSNNVNTAEGDDIKYYVVKLNDREDTLSNKLKNETLVFDVPNALKIVLQIADICCALKDVENNNNYYEVHHRNICPDSVLIDNDNNVRLAFFEKAKVHNDNLDIPTAYMTSESTAQQVTSKSTTQHVTHTKFANNGNFIHPYVRKSVEKYKTESMQLDVCEQMDIYSILVLLLYLRSSDVSCIHNERIKKLQTILENGGNAIRNTLSGYSTKFKELITSYFELCRSYSEKNSDILKVEDLKKIKGLKKIEELKKIIEDEKQSIEDNGGPFKEEQKNISDTAKYIVSGNEQEGYYVEENREYIIGSHLSDDKHLCFIFDENEDSEHCRILIANNTLKIQNFSGKGTTIKMRNEKREIVLDFSKNDNNYAELEIGQNGITLLLGRDPNNIVTICSK